MNYYDILLAKKLNGGGGGEATLIDKSISSNGTYNASSDNADGYKKVVVNVPNPSTGSLSITSNNTYDVTNYASAVVNVPQGITPTGTISITTNGTVDVTNYASADVNVSGGGVKTGTFTPATRSTQVTFDVGFQITDSLNVLVVPKNETPFKSGGKTLSFFISTPSCFWKAVQGTSNNTGASAQSPTVYTNETKQTYEGTELTVYGSQSYFETITYRWYVWE